MENHSPDTRTGIGFDIHRLIPVLNVGMITLGGVQIPCHAEVQAYSDGDVLLHAVTDAILGSLALGDIGSHFPDTSTENKSRNSQDFVVFAEKEARRLGWRVKQLDANVLLEAPKLAPFIDRIREQLAKLLSLELACVSVKAKTMEGLGAVGERLAMAAQVIVVMEERR